MGRLTGKYKGMYTNEEDNPKFRSPVLGDKYSTDKGYQDQESVGTIKRTITKGAGRDGIQNIVEEIPYYKKVNQTPEPDPTSTSESTSEPNPAPTPERAEAKERAQNFKADIRGDEGIDFSTDDPNNEERKNKYELNLLQQQVPGS